MRAKFMPLAYVAWGSAGTLMIEGHLFIGALVAASPFLGFARAWSKSPDPS